MNRTLKTTIFWLTVTASAWLLWQTVKSGGPTQAVPEISYSDFLAKVESGQVGKVTIAGGIVHGTDIKGGSFRVIAPPDQRAMIDALQQHGVTIWFKERPEPNWPNWLLNLAPLILLAALWFFMIRQIQRRRSGVEQSPTFPQNQQSGPRFGA
jgi:cell division protease FtsH